MLALALALGASVAWGGSDFVAGLASRRMPLLAVLVGSQVAGLALLLALLAVTGEAPPPGGAVLAAAGAGVAELLGFAALYQGLALGPMSVVAPISSAAALVPVVASLATGERPATAAVVGMGLVLLGAALACAERDTDADAADARRRAAAVPGAALAALAALSFGAFFVAMDTAAHDAGAAWAVALNRSTSVSVLVFAVALMRPRMGFARTDLATVATIGLLDAAANAMFAFALTRGLTSTVSVLGSLYPVTTVVLAAMVLDERVAPRQAAGVAIVLAGIGLVSAHP
jgi:drug/metabolite transporter (DMT)-like permease